MDVVVCKISWIQSEDDEVIKDIRPELIDSCTTFAIQVMVIKSKYGSDCMIDAYYNFFFSSNHFL
jgi:hypothetical protein